MGIPQVMDGLSMIHGKKHMEKPLFLWMIWAGLGYPMAWKPSFRCMNMALSVYVYYEED